jgi:hypothetical protein
VHDISTETLRRGKIILNVQYIRRYHSGTKEVIEVCEIDNAYGERIRPL